MRYTHVLNKGGMGVKSPLDMVCQLGCPPVINTLDRKQNGENVLYVYKN